ncbi:MAG TPA: aminotransferase class V-fold PLP-dependent enzyme [Gemmatimonadaceae bacterium]|nr:aminotransferase class V-fold PLP-dependent enzyme [Gemmatimonadaceae bacterium]
MHKRDFLRTLGATTIGALLGERLWAQYEPLPARTLAEDETFWAALRTKYRLKPDYINLEHGYYSMQSQEVLEAFIASVREVNYHAAFYMRTRQAGDKLAARTRLASVAGCSVDELIITRNTTESLDTVIAGYDWKPGDEAVMAAQDYGAMLDQFALQARRHGMSNTIVSLPNDPRSDDELVQLYANAITPKTRLLLVSHLVNITGQVMPVRRIADMARARNVAVAVDGAHAFAHLDFKVPELGADYYAASLHKWLGVPLGSGILYVRKDRIAGLWPLFGDAGFDDSDIRKLNHTGTHPVHTDLAIQHAITFHESIGVQRKEARLRHLQQYWTTKVRGVPNIVVNTPSQPHRTAAIANVGIGSMAPAALSKVLLEKYRIYTVAIDRQNVRGARVTPHLFTTPAELDQLVTALKELAATA